MLALSTPLATIRNFAADNHRSGLLTVVGVLLLGMWTLIVVFSILQKERLVSDNSRELAQLNSAVAQHTAALFKAIDTDLRVMDRWLHAHPTIEPRTDARFVALVQELQQASGGLIELRMVDMGGRLFHIPSRDGDSYVEVSDRGFFRDQLGGRGRILRIGDPVQSPGKKVWSIPVSWRLESPIGGILLVIANIELDQLASLHERMRLKPNGAIALIRLDGITLSRTPYDPSVVGKDLKGLPVFRNEFGAKVRGSFISESSPFDRMPKLISYERLVEYPVTVLVTRGMADMLQTYYSRLTAVVFAAGALTLLVLAFTFVLYRSLGALRDAKDALQRIATTDTLTGTMSRRAIFDLVQREFSRARRHARPAAVLALDMDHFKEVNDTHGHAVGDRVLRDSAAVWHAALREQDLLGRIGGEEFVIVLPETPSDAAQQVAERLRRAVSDLQLTGANGTFRVTVSIGLAMIAPRDETFAHTLERADVAMLFAKRQGRDRVELAIDGTAEQQQLFQRSPVDRVA